jgi:hypothetical protein
MRNRLLALGLGLAVRAFGAGYVYDYWESPVIADSTRWSSNGSPSFSSTGVSFSSAGSLISIPAISGVNPNDYEVNTTLAIKAGGADFIQFLRAANGRVTPGSGSYVSVELTVPAGFPNGGQGTLCVYQYVNGSATGLAGLYATVADGMNVLTEVAYVNVTTGSPGIGGYGIWATG